MNVLIIDDSRVMRRVNRAVVAQLGDDVDILEAEDGVAAIHQMKSCNFQVDLILCDWMMPRMNGLTFVKHLKGNPNLRQIPILMVTSQAEEQYIREAWRVGVDGYILKPFTKKMLLQSLLTLSPNREEQTQILDDLPEPDDKKKTFLDYLPKETVQHMLDIAEWLYFPENGTILSEGDDLDSLYFVVEGEVKAHASGTDPDSASARTLARGDCLAIAELMSDEPANAEYTAVASSRVARMPKNEFEKLLLEVPVVSISLTRYLASSARDFEAPEEEETDDMAALELPDLIQAMNLRQRTGVIEFPGHAARIALSRGQVVAAQCEELEGEEAFFALCRNTPKSFRFRSRQLKSEPNIQTNTMHLLLEWCRIMDEQDAA